MMKLTALLLCMAMLMSTFAGCGFLFDGGDNDESVDVFNPPYLENYYVNKHTPVAKQGGMEIYKYKNKNSETFTLGGNDYHGGIEFWSNPILNFLLTDSTIISALCFAETELKRQLKR